MKHFIAAAGLLAAAAIAPGLAFAQDTTSTQPETAPAATQPMTQGQDSMTADPAMQQPGTMGSTGAPDTGAMGATGTTDGSTGSMGTTDNAGSMSSTGAMASSGAAASGDMPLCSRTVRDRCRQSTAAERRAATTYRGGGRDNSAATNPG